jgi:hypothetical protein
LEDVCVAFAPPAGGRVEFGLGEQSLQLQLCEEKAFGLKAQIRQLTRAYLDLERRR